VNKPDAEHAMPIGISFSARHDANRRFDGISGLVRPLLFSKAVSSQRVIGVVVAVLAAAAACTEAQPEAASAPAAPNIEEPVIIDASPTTSSETGVVVWGVRRGETATIEITGYDEGMVPILAIEERVHEPSAVRRLIEITVRHDGDASRMRIDAEGRRVGDDIELSVETLQNDLTNDDRARRVLELFEADSRANAPRQMTGATVLSSSIRPLGEELTNGKCVNLTLKCGTALLEGAKSLAGMGSCMKVAKSLVKIGSCGVRGAGFGPWGAALGLSLCGVAEAKSLADNAPACVKDVISAADSASGIAQECSKDCEKKRPRPDVAPPR
jgi:hypothetical protein